MKTVVSRRTSANCGLLQKAPPDGPELTYIVLATRQFRPLPKREQGDDSRFHLAQLSRRADRLAESTLGQLSKRPSACRVRGLPPSSMSRHDASPILPRGATVFTYASKLRRVSSRRSPPNFSSSACARTMATIASPTTPAAGAGQMSERRWGARDSPP